jgi:hypothetical protein
MTTTSRTLGHANLSAFADCAIALMAVQASDVRQTFEPIPTIPQEILQLRIL